MNHKTHLPYSDAKLNSILTKQRIIVLHGKRFFIDHADNSHLLSSSLFNVYLNCLLIADNYRAAIRTAF